MWQGRPKRAGGGRAAHAQNWRFDGGWYEFGL